MDRRSDGRTAEELLADAINRPGSFGQAETRRLIRLLRSRDPKARLSASWAIGLAVEHNPTLVDSNIRRLARSVESEIAETDAIRTIAYIAEHRPDVVEKVLSLANVDRGRAVELAPEIVQIYRNTDHGPASVVGDHQSKLGRERTSSSGEETASKSVDEVDPDDTEDSKNRSRPPAATGDQPPESPPEPPPPRSLRYSEFAVAGPMLSQGPIEAVKAKYQADGRQYPVTLKRLRSRLSPTDTRRIADELSAWDSVGTHPAAVSVVGWGIAPGGWIAHQYIDGGTVADRRGPVPPREAYWIVERISDAIRYAHGQGMIHGCLSPSSVGFGVSFGVSKAGDPWNYPFVMDWGCLRLYDADSAPKAGFPIRYAAPEQLAPDRFGRVDALTDVYQLGALAYRLFTGRAPYQSTGPTAATAVIDREPPPPSEVHHAVPDAIGPILQTCLASSKLDRYETVEAFRRELAAVRSEVGL